MQKHRAQLTQSWNKLIAQHQGTYIGAEELLFMTNLKARLKFHDFPQGDSVTRARVFFMGHDKSGKRFLRERIVNPNETPKPQTIGGYGFDYL